MNTKTNTFLKLFLACACLTGIFALISGITSIKSGGLTGYFIVVIGAIFIITAVVASFLSDNLRLKISISLIMVIAGVYAFNLIINVTPLKTFASSEANSLSKRLSTINKMGITWDTRNRTDVIHDLKQKHNDVYSVTFPDDSFYNASVQELFGGYPDRVVWPLSGIAGVTTVYGIESGQYMIYTSDRYGFNNDDSVYHRPNDRIMLLGDSFIHGCCVQKGEDVAAILRSRNYNAINMGMGGNGPLAELATLREYGPTIKPKVVLWFYYENDLDNLVREYNHPVLKKYLSNPNFTQSLANRQSETDSFWKSVLAMWETNQTSQMVKEVTVFNVLKQQSDSIKNFLMLKTLRSALKPIMPISNYREPNADELVRLQNVLKAAKLECAKLNCQLKLVYLPSYRSVANNHQKSFSAIATGINQLDIPVINFHESINHQDNPLTVFPLRLRGHYNREGYKLLANVVEDLIQNLHPPRVK